MLLWQHTPCQLGHLPSSCAVFYKHVLMIQISEFHCDILIRVNNVLGQIPFLFLLLSVNGTYLLLHYDERLLQCKGQWTAESRFHIGDESRQHIPVGSVTATEGRGQACASLPLPSYFLDHSFIQLTIWSTHHGLPSCSALGTRLRTG